MLQIYELHTIRLLSEAGSLAICTGGGGIPVIRDHMFVIAASKLAMVAAFSLHSWGVNASNSNWHIQYQYGFASDADFVPSLVFLLDRSQERTFLHSLNIGKQVADSFFGTRAEVTVNIGLQHFGENDFQSDITGGTVYWKINKHISLPIVRFPLRLGLGQGLSYVSSIPVSEVRDFEPESSARLLYYLEFTAQVSLSRLLGRPGTPLSATLQDIHFGYSIFHRSSVYGVFADEGGGINYPGIGIDFIFR